MNLKNRFFIVSIFLLLYSATASGQNNGDSLIRLSDKLSIKLSLAKVVFFTPNKMDSCVTTELFNDYLMDDFGNYLNNYYDYHTLIEAGNDIFIIFSSWEARKRQPFIVTKVFRYNVEYNNLELMLTTRTIDAINSRTFFYFKKKGKKVFYFEKVIVYKTKGKIFGSTYSKIKFRLPLYEH
jgi:hypothetical protein